MLETILARERAERRERIALPILQTLLAQTIEGVPPIDLPKVALLITDEFIAELDKAK